MHILKYKDEIILIIWHSVKVQQNIKCMYINYMIIYTNYIVTSYNMCSIHIIYWVYVFNIKANNMNILLHLVGLHILQVSLNLRLWQLEQTNRAPSANVPRVTGIPYLCAWASNYIWSSKTSLVFGEDRNLGSKAVGQETIWWFVLSLIISLWLSPKNCLFSLIKAKKGIKSILI